ncbi:MAG: lipase family protein [Pirellulales bacterium]
MPPLFRLGDGQMLQAATNFARPLAIQLASCCRYAADFASRARPPRVVDERQFSGAFAHTSNAVWLRFAEADVLAFQTTVQDDRLRSAYDWLQNLRARAVAALDLPGCVHLGFAGQLRPILDDLLRHVRDSADDRPLYLTGHSQGAALAVLATKALEQSQTPATAAYVFGCPRVGDLRFVESIETPIVRLEFGHDVVPQLPLCKPTEGPLSAVWETLRTTLPPQCAECFAEFEDDFCVHQPAGVLHYALTPRAKVRLYDAAAERELAVRRVLRFAYAGRAMVEHHYLRMYLEMLTARRS